MMGLGGFLTGGRRLKLCRGGGEIFGDDENFIEQFQISPLNIWIGLFCSPTLIFFRKMRLHDSLFKNCADMNLFSLTAPT